MEDYLTVTQAAAILTITPRRVRQLVAEGQLTEVTRAGKSVILRRDDVERLARDGWQGRRPPPGAD